MVIETIEVGDKLCSLKAALRDLSDSLDKKAVARIEREIAKLEKRRG